MPWIEHVGLDAIRKGHHHDAGRNCICISITDPDYQDARIYWPFKHIFRFKFFDDSESFTEAHAREIINILHIAQDERANVVVHCHAGVCRSAAVAYFGSLHHGFDLIPKAAFLPNAHVLSTLNKVMGISPLTLVWNTDKPKE